MSSINAETVAALQRENAALREQITLLNNDIPHRKEIEATLSSNQTLLAAILDHASAVLMVKRRNGTIVLSNHPPAANSSVVMGQLIGKAAPEPLSGELFSAWWESEQRVLETGIAETCEEIVSIENELHTFKVSRFPIFGDTDTPVAIGTVATDITECKRAEQEFRKLQQAVAQSPSSIVIANREGNIEYVNPRFVQVTGYSFEEVRGQNPRIFKSGETPPEEYQRLWDTITAGHEWRGEFHNRKKNGALYWESVSISPITDATGQITSFIAIKEDITERKQMEEALNQAYAVLEQGVEERTRELALSNQQLRDEITRCEEIERALRHSEMRYREITELISDSIYSVRCNADGTCELEWGFNKLEQLMGYAFNEVSFTHWPNLVHPDDRTLFAHHIERLCIGRPIESEYRIVTRSGEIRWLRDHARPVWDEQEKRAVRIYGAIKDITVYRRTSQALRESERMLSTLMSNLPGMAYRCKNDRQWSMEFVSNGAQTLTGYTPADLVGPGAIAYADLIHPDDRNQVWHEVQAAIATRCPFGFRYRIRPASGEEKWVWEQGVGVFDDEGKLLVLEGFITDITEHRRVEETLRESEARLSTLLSALPDMVFRLDRDGILVDFENPLDDHLPMPPEAFLGRFYEEVLPPHLSEQLCSTIARARQSGIVERFEYCLSQNNLPHYDYEARVVVGSDEHTFCIVRNITHYKQAEARIRQHAARAEALVRVAARLNAQLDLKAILHAVCVEMQQALQVEMVVVCLYDAQLDAMVFADGLGISEKLVASLVPLPLSLISRQMPVRAIPDLRQEQGCPDPCQLTNFNARSMIRALVLRDEEIVGMILGFSLGESRLFTEDEMRLLQGIADQAAQAIANARLFDAVQQERALLSRRVAERTADLSRSNAELARAMRIKDEFLASMSHELRTPLHTVLGMSEALQEQVYGPFNERQLRSLAAIEQSGRHLLMLINDILDLSKIEAGKIDLQIATVAIDVLCQSSLHFIKQQATKKRIGVSLRMDTPMLSVHHSERQIFLGIELPHITMQADERRLKQILINLLANAVKFTPEGGQVGLDVRVEEEQQVVHFTVWDTGIGIALEDQQRLFQPFIQIDSRLARQYEGTGLGLALVLRLTELHSGSVTLESEPGKGSRFTVSLPQFAYTGPNLPMVASRLEQDAAIASLYPAITEENTAQPRSLDTPGPLILLAEDNESSILTTVNYLVSKGYRVRVARNGLEVIGHIREQQPALILMDIQMPKLNGLETIRQIRADMRLLHIPIIALTALAMQGDRERCIEAGANDYLSKPVRLQELVRIMEAHLNHMYAAFGFPRAQNLPQVPDPAGG